MTLSRFFFYACMVILFSLLLFHDTPMVKAQDLRILKDVQSHTSGFLDDVAVLLAIVGAPFPSMILIGVLALILLLRKKWKELVLFLLLFVLMTGFEVISKSHVQHPRPGKKYLRDVEAFHLFRYMPDVSVPGENSFPSGHSLRSLFLVGVLAVLLGANRSKKTRIALVLSVAAYCFISGWARVYLGAHWPSDVVGGFVLGGAGLVIYGIGQDFIEGYI